MADLSKLHVLFHPAGLLDRVEEGNGVKKEGENNKKALSSQGCVELCTSGSSESEDSLVSERYLIVCLDEHASHVPWGQPLKVESLKRKWRVCSVI